MPNNGKTALDTFTELSEFGRLANSTEDIEVLLERACCTISHALGTEKAKVLARIPENENMLQGAALHGYGSDAKGRALEVKEGSAAGYALYSGKPVISEDINKETRFGLNEIEEEYGVRSMANVVIPSREGEPDYGVLEVDRPASRDFEEKDTFFLQAYANFIASALNRIEAAKELEKKS